MIKLRSSRFKLFLLAGIVLIAAFLRLYRIDSLPPGDGYDPAYYGLDALSILRGARPIFLPENYGREPLFSYLVAAFFALFGVSPKAIYLASATVGILTIPAVYLMAEEMFAGEGDILAQFGGLVAALATAISYWHLNWSRLGVRAILVPFFLVLTLYCLWRGLRTGSRMAFLGSGLFLGLGMYTYQAFRALPLLVVLAFVYVAVYRRARNQVSLEKPGFYLVNLGLVVVVSLIVFAPMGYYFLTHPGSFFQRIEQTIVVGPTQRVTSDAPHGLTEQVKDALLMFNFHGDEWPITNLPGRPALGPFLSVAFLLGIGVSLRRIREPLYLFLLTWLVVMTVPAFLAQYGPAAKRAIGTLPAAVMLVALGTLVAWDWVRRWAAGRSAAWARTLPAAAAILIGAGFVYTGVATYCDYFIVWGQNPDLFTHFEAGESAIGKYVGQLPALEQVYISPVPPNHPSVVFNSQEREGLKGYNGRVCVVAPERTAHDTMWVIVPRDDKNSLDLLARYYPQGGIVGKGPLHYNEPFFLAYEVAAGIEAHVEPAHPLRADFDNQIQLLGYDLASFTYRPGDTLQLFLYYRRLGQIEKDYTVSTQLLGPHNPATNGPLWAQDDSEPCRRFYPTSTWDEGEVVRDQYTIPIPAETPPGDYQLIMGLYDWQTLERLPVLDAAGQVVADNVILGQVHVTEHE
ncbi:MAG: glycosyltransferase family 39 protein [Anaerolineae bacterium]